MTLTDDDIKEFREIWKAEFKENISEGDARIAANNLLELFAILGTRDEAHKPSPKQLFRAVQDIKKPDLKEKH